MVPFALRNPCKRKPMMAATWLHPRAGERLHICAAHSHRTFSRVSTWPILMGASPPCSAVELPRCRASEDVCNHTVESAGLRMPRSRVLLAAHAIMWFGVVVYDETPCRRDSRATTFHFDRTTRRSSLRSATLLLPPPTEKQSSPSRLAMPPLRGS